MHVERAILERANLGVAAVPVPPPFHYHAATRAAGDVALHLYVFTFLREGGKHRHGTACTVRHIMPDDPQLYE